MPFATTATSVTTTNPLVDQAHASANSIFQTHVQVILQHSTSVGLRRLIKSRIRAHYLLHGKRRNNTANDVDNTAEESDVSILFKDNPNLLRVTQEDMDKCYSFARRVGIKWADELKRQGCVEFSDIVLEVVNRGHYLEPSGETVAEGQQNEADDETNGMNSSANKKAYATPYAALHSLRRYEPDCDGSGKPLKHLHPVRQDENDLSARKIIQQIDEMARNNQTYWQHGWYAVEEAVKRNRERIDYSRANQEDVGKESKGRKKRVHFEGDASEQEETDDEVEVSNKRRCATSNVEIETAVEADELFCAHGRAPSSIGDTVYSWEDISQSMSSQERKQLITSAIHPPYPFEEDAVHDASDVTQPTSTMEVEHSTNIVGALKEVGLTHLFEQTRHLPKERQAHDDGETTKQNSSNGFESFLGASETRASFKTQQLDRLKKKAMRKAEKERLGRRAPVLGEKNANYYGFGTASGKVKLTDNDTQLPTKAKREPPTGNRISLQILDEPERQRWLEFDLGECILEELVEEGEGGRSSDQNNRRFLAFRSLEVAIAD